MKDTRALAPKSCSVEVDIWNPKLVCVNYVSFARLPWQNLCWTVVVGSRICFRGFDWTCPQLRLGIQVDSNGLQCSDPDA